MVDKAFLQEVRDRIALSKYIGQHVELKRSGSNYKGLCPFHHEKTPSFMVSDEKQIFHCFGCSVGGDVITFLMKHQGLSFPEAVETLAKEAGLPMPASFDGETDQKRKFLLLTVQKALEIYKKQLSTNSSGMATSYLKKRGVSDKTREECGLGFSPEYGNLLYQSFNSQPKLMKSAIELGLIRSKTPGNYYDFFRNRLIFPIFSPRGEPIAFSARALGSKQEPKYLNSPESSLFHKSNALYGLNMAGKAIRLSDMAIIVEGQFDAISAHQGGVSNVVAPLGTALTAGHLHVLSRYTNNITLVFDGDNAGKKAAWRMLPIFIQEGLMPRAAMLPDGEDPDSIVRTQGIDIFKDYVNKSPLLLELLLHWLLEKDPDNTKRLDAIKKFEPIINLSPNSAEKDLYRQILSEKLGVSLSKFANITKKAYVSSKIPAINISSAEQQIAKTLVTYPHLYKQFSQRLDSLSFSDTWSKTILNIIVAANKISEDAKTTHLLQETDDEELQKEISAISMEMSDLENPEDLIEDCIRHIEKQSLEYEIAAIDNKLRQGKSNPGDQDTELDLLSQRQKLEKKRRELMIGAKEG